MPSVKIPRKSTVTDMTPFVDVAFLILSFFMLATKFKPPEPAPISTPKSVSADKLAEDNAVLVEFDSTGRVFFSMGTKKASDASVKRDVIEAINKSRNLGLTEREMKNFEFNTQVGVPFTQLKNLLAQPVDQRVGMLRKATGIPIDSANNELHAWVSTAKAAFYNHDKKIAVNYIIKGDNNANYPSFDGVIEAMRRSDQYNFKLVTNPKEPPVGTEYYRIRNEARNK